MKRYFNSAVYLFIALLAGVAVCVFFSWIPPKTDPKFRAERRYQREAEQYMRAHLDEIKSIDTEKSYQDYIKHKAEYDAANAAK